ncbi:hypothetical protein ACE14D_10475 [Streptomyces sp. Act-28]
MNRSPADDGLGGTVYMCRRGADRSPCHHAIAVEHGLNTDGVAASRRNLTT